MNSSTAAAPPAAPAIIGTMFFFDSGGVLPGGRPPGSVPLVRGAPVPMFDKSPSPSDTRKALIVSGTMLTCPLYLTVILCWPSGIGSE